MSYLIVKQREESEPIVDYEYDDEDTSMDNVVEGDIMVKPSDNDDRGLRAAMTTDQDRNGIL